MVASMNLNNKNVRVGIGIALAVLAGALFVVFQNRPAPPPSNEDLTAMDTSLGTPESQDSETGIQFPSVMPGVRATMPRGATAIDEYAFTNENGVQFLSITSTSTLVIPDANAATFRRITDFMQSPDPAVASTCGIAGKYAFYADSKRVYFYQFWLAPKFRTSRVEVIADAKPETFKVLSPIGFEDGTRSLYLDYDVVAATTTTCTYAIRAR